MVQKKLNEVTKRNKVYSLKKCAPTASKAACDLASFISKSNDCEPMTDDIKNALLQSRRIKRRTSRSTNTKDSQL